jgi:hypothetical protein
MNGGKIIKLLLPRSLGEGAQWAAFALEAKQLNFFGFD